MSPSTLVLRENFLVTKPPGATSEPGKILLAHRQKPTMDWIKTLLEAQHYSVQATREGEASILAAKEFLPDIILMDTRLSDKTGFEVCRQLKEEETTRHIPVLFMMPLEPPEDLKEVFKAGGNDFITIPFSGEEILRRVELHLEMLRLKSELAIERKEKERLSQENKHWERSFNKQVKQSTLEMEEAFILERSAREQMISKQTLTMMNKMAAQVVQELSQPLYNLRLIITQMRDLAQENPNLAKSLDYSLVEIERLLKTITELTQVRDL